MTDIKSEGIAAPTIVERDVFGAQIDALRLREKAHTRGGDVIAAARRRLPMVRVDGSIPLTSAGGKATLLDAFEGRTLLIAYYFKWHRGKRAPEQCEGCTWVLTQVSELSYMHAHDA